VVATTGRFDRAGVKQRWEGSRAARTLTRYGQGRGSLLSGGIAYSGLFSLFAVLTLYFTVFAAVVGRDPALRASVVGTIDTWMPGLVRDGTSGGGLITVDELTGSTGLSWARVVAGVVLLVTAVSFMAGLRGAVRTMFDLEEVKENLLVAWGRAALGFVLVGGAVAVASVLDIAVGQAASWAGGAAGGRLAWVGGGVAQVVGHLVAWAVQALAVVALFRVVAGAHPPRRDLWLGAGAAALVLSVARFFAAYLVGRASHNPLLVSVAVVLGLMVWMNLMARVVLLAAAWTGSATRRPGSRG